MTGRLARTGTLLRELAAAVRLVLRATPGWSALNVVCAVFLSVLPVLALYLTKLTLDRVLAASAHGFREIPGDVWRLIFFAVGTVWAQGAVRTVAGFVSEMQGQRVSEAVQETIAEKSVQVDLSYYESPAYYNTLHQAQREAPSRPARIVSALAAALQSALSVLAVGGLVLLSLRWSTVLLVVAVAVPGLWLRMRHARALSVQQKALAPLERRLDYYGWLGSTPGHAKEIRVYGLGKVFLERVREARRTLFDRKLRLQRGRIFSDVLTQGFAAVAMAAAFSQMIRNTLAGTLSVGALVMGFQAFQRGVGGVQELVGALSQLYEHGLFMERLSEFLALQIKIVDPAAPLPFPARLQAGIRFEDVSFQYPGSATPVIQGLNLSIEAGQMVALVGENGAGKSTLIKLLCRLYEPTGGRITLDGTDLRCFRRQELWTGMAVLFQDFGQYQATVADNIWFGDCAGPAEQDRVRRAAARAGADEFIQNLPDAYGQMLGAFFEGGRDLSGGQWQRLALSRAMLRATAPMVVLDEPTSALDVKAEHDLFTRFKSLTRGRTSLVISHRMSTVRMADRIFLFENGRIAEAGSHDELLDAGGSYARLFETQASNYR